MADDIEMLAAQNSYGYGRWDAPYWFIGPEPGRAKKEGDNLAERCRAWLELCDGDPEAGALIDCYDHHAKFGSLDLFVPRKGKKRVPTQGTWRQLIRLLLAYEGKPDDIRSIAEYQATKLGRSDGETCIVEMSALAMNRVADAQDLREKFRAMRAERLRGEASRNHPEFVVMYGGGAGLRPSWQVIGCGDQDANCFETKEIVNPWSADFALRNGTVFVVSKHPVNPGGAAPPAEYWTGIAAEIRRLRRSARARID